MRGAQRSLRRADGRGCGGQARGRDSAAGKLPVEIDFGRDQLLPERNGLGLHGVEKLLRARVLRVGEVQFPGELQHMFRSRIAVELAGQGQAHAAALSQVRQPFTGKSLERPRLHAGIGLRALGKRGDRLATSSVAEKRTIVRIMLAISKSCRRL